MNASLVIDWLLPRLSEYAHCISIAAIFGSIARNSEKPSDCDFLIVSNADVDSEEWQSLRKHIHSVEIEFARNFSLPLNVTLVTEGEWEENRSIYKDLILVKLKAG